MRTSTVATTVAGTLLALTLTGCGGDEEPTAGEPAPSASSPTESPTESPSESPTESETTDEPTDDRAASDAFLDRLKAGMGEEGSVHVDMDMTGLVDVSAEGDTTYGPDGSEMRLTMQVSNVPGGPMEMVVVDEVAYMSIPGVTGRGKFFEIDKSHPAFKGFDAGMSPTDSFKAFEAGLESVEEVGADEVGGDPTTHYRLEVDAQKAMGASGQPTVPGLPDTLTYDVWLDAEDRMRRIVYELGGNRATVDMTAWGEDVTIQAPDKTDIVKAPPTMS